MIGPAIDDFIDLLILGWYAILIKLFENSENVPNRGHLEMLAGSGGSNPK